MAYFVIVVSAFILGMTLARLTSLDSPEYWVILTCYVAAIFAAIYV